MHNEETFNHLAANSFRKRCNKFHQNRPNFVADITKKTFWFFFWTQCITRIYGRIGEIFVSYRKSGSRKTMVTSDLRAEVEIWPIRACAVHPAINIITVRSLQTWLWGRHHVPQNVFVVCFIICVHEYWGWKPKWRQWQPFSATLSCVLA